MLEILADQTDLTKEEKDRIGNLTAGHVLMFATGTPTPPVLGFDPKPTMKFIHDETRFIPSAHTCANVLNLYVNDKSVKGPFHQHLLTALMNGGVFSKL